MKRNLAFLFIFGINDNSMDRDCGRRKTGAGGPASGDIL